MTLEAAPDRPKRKVAIRSVDDEQRILVMWVDVKVLFQHRDLSLQAIWKYK